MMFRYITYKRRGRKTTKKIRKRLFWQRWDRLHVNRAADVSCGARNILLLAQDRSSYTLTDVVVRSKPVTFRSAADGGKLSY